MQQHDEQGQPNGQPDIYVMQARIQMLFEALREVKSLLKSIEETVGLIRVFDVQIKQLGSDFSRLEIDVREYKRDLEDLELRLGVDIAEVKKMVKEETDKAKDVAGTTRTAIESKVSYVQGIIAAVTVLGALVYAAAGWWVSRYTSMTDDHNKYIHTLQTLDAEDHLRQSMAKPPTRYDLDTKPKVVGEGGEKMQRSEESKEDTPRL